jgi:hypothetical protein
MEEPNFENPLELTCAEADDIFKLRKKDKSSYMEDKLLDAHCEKCAGCQAKREEEGKDESEKD